MFASREQNEISPIVCIFFSEFHPVAGPKITYQVPKDYLSKESFDSLSVYIIPKHELHGKLMTVNALGHKIIGFPMIIDNPKKYTRNELIFNLCFVCKASQRSVQYEPLVKKLANYLFTLELECDFLTEEHTKAKLPDIMGQIRKDLNESGYCSIPINESNTIYLKVIPVRHDCPLVLDHEVPIFTQNKTPALPSEWDLTTQQILPYIDGFRHIAKIAIEANVEISLVKACIRNMVYYGVIRLIPIFMYSNVYTPTQKLHQLAIDPELQEECLQYVARQGCHRPTFRMVFMLYCLLCPGTTVKNLCTRRNPRGLGIDERKLIQFGLMHGLIRRLQKYPIQITQDGSVPIKQKSFSKYFTGSHSFDEICCKTGLSYQELDEKVDKDPSVVVCWK